MFFLLYIDILMTVFLMIFRRFATTFRRFLKIFQNCSEGRQTFLNIFRTFPHIFQRLPKIAEDCRWWPKKNHPKMFRSYTNKFKCSLRDKRNTVYVVKNDIFTCGDIISFLSICCHLVYHWFLYNKKWYYTPKHIIRDLLSNCCS